ncbi:MAG TPA: FG-GAP-like repeat-containing protein [Pyrinomonadaceae bacterium]
MFIFKRGFQKSITTIFSFLFLALLFVNTTAAAPGDLDVSFGSGGKAVAPVGRISFDRAWATARQADGKIVIAGDSAGDYEFGTMAASYIVSRVNPDGSLDTSFGVSGKAVKRLRALSRANAVIVQPDGKIVVGGFIFAEFEPGNFRSAFLLVRFNGDGSADNSFGSGGIVVTPFENGLQGTINSMALQADGKIVAAGYSYLSSTGSPQSFAAARYNPNGSLDNSFDGDGKAFVNINESGNRANAVVIQTDGKIVLGGTTRLNLSSLADFALARLNADGALDNSFDGDGKLTTRLGATNSFLAAISLQSDGKIVAAGISNSSSTTRDAAVVRYNTDGALDNSFDMDGIVTTNIGDDVLTDVEIQSDEKIVVVGQTSISTNGVFDFLAVRYNTDGALDNSFDGDGKVTTHVADAFNRANGALIQPDGKIVLVGTSGLINESDISLTRYNPNGALDNSFDADGIAVIELANSVDIVYDTALQADGKIVAAGYGFDGARAVVTVARFNSNGSIDTTFGEQGAVVTPFTDFHGFANEVLVQPDGKILVTAWTFGGFYKIIRYNSDGALDNSFGAMGIATIQLSTIANVDVSFAMALQPDGKIIVGGGSTTPEGSGASLVRLNADGTLDTAFGNGGKVITIIANRQSTINSLALQPDGKIVGAGYSRIENTNNQSFFVCRYNPNGTPDASFGGTGTVFTSFGSFDSANVVLIQSDGKIVAAGTSDNRSALARYNIDGSLDASFDGDGKVVIQGTNSSTELKDAVLQPNGKLILAGIVTSGTDRNSAVVRLKPDGSFDSSFHGGIVITPNGDLDDGYYAVLLQPDGKIVAAGYSSNGANDDFTLVRYLGGEVAAAQRALFDFDGDNKTDISVYRPADGVWYLNQSQSGFNAVQFGLGTDKIAPADYDGDGKTDFGVFRDGVWYLLRSQAGFTAVQFGATGDLPRPADYDGDGKADLAVFRPSDGTWYLLQSTNGFTGVQFGTNGDIPVPADFDGDGRADINVYRPSAGSWYRLNSSNGQFIGVQFGVSEDLPTPADFDGDGKADINVFRPSTGTWYRLNSSNDSFTGIQFGAAGDSPTAGDYDGDGKADISVFRPSNGSWYRINSTNSQFIAAQFGQNGDKAVPSAHLP